MSKSPAAIVQEKFGDKAKLVAALQPFTNDALWLPRTNASKGLAHVSNAKLLRLHAIFTEVKGKFGDRFKLVDALLEIEKRTKDEGYKKRLLAYPVPRLYDAYKAAAKRAGVSTKAAAEKPAKKVAAKAPAAKKAPAKKPAAKKPAAKKNA